MISIFCHISTVAFTAPFRALSSTCSIRMQNAPAFDPVAFAKTLPGISAPLGYFDPLGFCTENGSNEAMTEGKIRFYREVELKHGRVAMLAAVGFPVAEQFHPLFATDDVPSVLAFQQTALQTFWPLVIGVIAIPEIFSVFTFENPASRDAHGNPAQPWTIKKDHIAGDLGFDPLHLKPTNPQDFFEMQTKELNNSRLAMLAITLMVIQEAITGAKIF